MQTTRSDLKKPRAAVELIKDSIDKAQRLKSLGAFIHLAAESALVAATKSDNDTEQSVTEKPLLGMPFVVKDNIHVAGMPNSAGTLALKNFTPSKNNPVVERLLKAGAIILGKTNMHELAFGITSNNAAFGPVANVHDQTLIAGGSSGGTAAAIAAGIVPMGLGTDTGGSVRIPATLNGIMGFRPTLGRYDSGDVTPVASTRDTIGPMAKTVAELLLMDQLITGDDEYADVVLPLSNITLGVPRCYFYENLSPDVNADIKACLSRLKQAGVSLKEIDLPGLEEANDGVSFPVALYEFTHELPEYLSKHTCVSWAELVDQVKSPDVVGAIQSQSGTEAIPDSVYSQAINHFRPKLQSIYREAFKHSGVDAFIVPATALVASPIKSCNETVALNGEQVPTFNAYIRNTDPTSNAGLPSLALPSGKNSAGLPMGVLLDGPVNSDRRLLAIGHALASVLAAD